MPAVHRNTRPHLGAIALMLILLMTVSGCAGMHPIAKLFGGRKAAPASAEAIAYGALGNFNHGKYQKALKAFDELKNRFPFSQFSLLAELKTADCKYYLEDYAEAAVLYQDFIDNHPTNEAVPYVMFQIGMCHFKQIDTIDRDPAGAYASIQAFNKLLRSYPLSPYSDEARAKIRAAKTFLARHEMYVADFYIRREHYKEAEGRLKYLLTNYPDSAPAPKAKKLLADLRAGKPPKSSWIDWLPDISLPSWKTFKGSVVPGVPGAAGPSQ